MRLTIKHWASCLALAIVLAATLTSCNKDDASGNRLTDGKYPIALSTAIGQTNTRTEAGATDAQTIWTVGDQIGFFADGGYDNIPCTATATDGGSWSGLYWTNKSDLKNIKAYYPYQAGGYLENDKVTFSIQADQSQKVNYYKSDIMLGTASPASFDTPVALSFTRLMSKLTVELTTEEANLVSLSELKGAKVQVTNMHIKGSFSESSFGTTGNGDNMLTMYNRSTDDKALFQVIAVATTMLGNTNQIIITSADGMRVYKGTFESQTLEANKQYAYNFKVSVKSLTVTVNSVAAGVAWEEGVMTSSDPKEAKYIIDIPTELTAIEELKLDGADITSNINTIENSVTGFVVTYKRQNALPVQARFISVVGRYKLARSYDATTSIYSDTYTEIASNVKLTWVNEVTEVGDYLYSDGTWSAHPYRTDNSYVGIVFYVGAGPEDAASKYDNAMSEIHGYAVGLKNASNAVSWYSGDNTRTPVSTSQTAFNGYSNTKLIKKATAYSREDSPAVASCVEYGVVVTGGSDWYLPSAAQLLSFYDLRDIINKRLSQITDKDIQNVTNHYWSSTAKASSMINFSGFWYDTYKYIWGSDNRLKTRPVITF